MRTRRIILLLSLAPPIGAQISPGPLSKAHAGFSGSAQCGSCHTFGSGTPRLKCLGCHTEIQDRLQKHTGYHAAVVHNTSEKEDCARCHQEHAGVNFSIIRWEKPRTQFDHRLTGYPLDGKHAAVVCEKCHTESHVSKEARAAIKIRDLNRTYLGLDTQCASCHADEHRGQLGTDCAHCHSVDGWKPVTNFDHSSTRYPLMGLHATKTTCAECHKPLTDISGKSYIQYKGIAFGACSNCHKDPHRGAFESNCQSCHAVNGWKQVNISSGFDHSRTKYPLLGLHAKVDCFKCHATDNFKEPVAHERCDACHKPDPHSGQFAKQDCAACHSESGFKTTSFDATRHQKTRYPLTGRHNTVECAKCHTPAGAATIYQVKFDACTDCHKDLHQGQFATAKYSNKCDQCHTVDGFRPSTFTKMQHQQTDFALSGGHAATACVECHKPSTPGDATTTRYHFASTTCTDCHQDPHRGQFKGALASCESCHGLRTWKDVSKFDHDTTKFKLEGAHRPTGCLECHKPANFAKGIEKVVFKDAPTQCEGCHENIHEEQFNVNGFPPECITCHNLTAWKPARFDHEKQSKFSLKGAHERVPCGDCHKSATAANGRLTTQYKGTSSVCADCH
jgi:hypothetical protein